MTSSDSPKSETSGGGEVSPHLAPHFDTLKQQYDSAKLGMWIFLVTEILFFSGLFCAYAVFRANRPEVFVDGHHFLDTPLGALNTVILIFSSLTMALAVRSAQRGKGPALIGLLAVTAACGLAFLGVKAFEYKSKWDHRLVPGQERIEYWLDRDTSSRPSVIPRKEFDPQRQYVREHLAHAGSLKLSEKELDKRIDNLRSFVGIYFALTGLHALHVIAGIGVILWLLLGAVRGRFGSQYFTPVDLGGLYWHLVDLIWIYLFPLLYLIP
jgi:cytochrome c oxidase subunit 3